MTTSTVLAFALLAAQMMLPWLASSFVTQDGPSHLYTARVAREILVDPGGPFGKIYQFDRHLTTNWASLVVFNGILTVFEPADAEKAMMSLCVLAGFFSLGMLAKSIGIRSPWSPWINVVIGTWFLWIGFYNFHVGIVAAILVYAYYLGHWSAMGWTRVGAVALGSCVLFFVHVFAASFLITAVAVSAVWLHLLAPMVVERRRPLLSTAVKALRPLALVGIAFLPAGTLLLGFVAGSPGSLGSNPEFARALSLFPMHVFASSFGGLGEQLVLWPSLLLYMWLGVCALTRREWASEVGAVAVAGGAMFALYLLVPDGGLGGGEIKIRFAWLVFLLGLAAVAGASRLEPLRGGLAVYVACLFGAHLVQSWQVNVHRPAPALEVYREAMADIPAGSSYVRVYRSSASTRARFGFQDAGFEPLFHFDSAIAAERGLLALSDYQAHSRAFPIVCGPDLPHDRQLQLRGLESTGGDGDEALRDLLIDPPVPIDFVVLVGDPSEVHRSEAAGDLTSKLRLVSDRSFVRVYSTRLGERGGISGPS